MLVLLYPELLKASEPALPPHRRHRPPRGSHPPRRLRRRAARALASAASRLDRESARRAIA